MSEWISVDDRMPELMPGDRDCTVNVLVFKDSKEMLTGFYSHDDESWYDSDGEVIDTLIFYVTHWMPLPAPPSA